jgi:serine/threonine protein kinase
MTERFATGTRIGDYLIDAVVTGKNGDLTYQATHVLLPRRASLQILHPAFTGLAPVAVQLIREGCILEALHHVGVPRMYECGVLADRRPWTATELVDGEPLQGGLPVAAVIDLVRDVAEILDHAHRRGVVHRNLRPLVILRCAPRRGFGHCVIDWSSARVYDATPTQLVPSGSLRYRAPELVTGDFDGRADVFSLGAIADEALADALPAAPLGLTALLDRMLARDPANRPTAGEVRFAAAQLAEVVELVPDEPVAEEVVVLVDLPDDPEPPVIKRKLKWTPGQGLETQPGIRGRAVSALKRGRP